MVNDTQIPQFGIDRTTRSESEVAQTFVFEHRDAAPRGNNPVAEAWHVLRHHRHQALGEQVHSVAVSSMLFPIRREPKLKQSLFRRVYSSRLAGSASTQCICVPVLPTRGRSYATM
jgi:hypothetical protein